MKSYLYVACKLFSCNTCGYTYVLYTNLQASIQLCFHDFKANIKVVLTTLMTWQTFQGEMRERERKKEQKVIFSNRATDSIISVEITDQHWALVVKLKADPQCSKSIQYS